MDTVRIVKIGGNIIDDPQALDDFLVNFSKLQGPKVLVHGGGKLASKLALQMGVEVQMTHGRRITDLPSLEIVTMVYAGQINKTIIAKLQANQCNAVGFSGADGNAVVAVQRPVKTIDFGYVGDVKKVDLKVPELLLGHGITPVFCAITHNEEGQLLNTNADTIASELALAFSKNYKTALYYCFDKKGVLRDKDDENSVIRKITAATFKELVDAKYIVDGMIPKLENCFYALENGVQKIEIGLPSMIFEPETIHTILEN
ncbi:acetylglutamate kinase [Polaribacter pacificus]|uniref:Acetylglutamate kinase n=1 Tax=Polaribacter pacificus TaxID=1775173 RepID=A0A917MC90_9FLAO|nr:acetylglutamate kinase [Polaribacter pacificus]GGG91961.1 acetylglutamate kinase [Polaribacter pacificus]